MVKVTVMRDSSGGAKRVEEHASGRATILRDGGHLGVVSGLSRDADVVAVYAPGQWISAVVEQ